MKKSRILALLLTTVMILSCTVPVMAADYSNVRQYGKEGGYLAIGDSFSRGTGAAGYYTDGFEKYDNRVIEGAFPYLVAQAVGCTSPQLYTSTGNYWPEAFTGQTLSATLDLLGVDDGFTDTAMKYGNYYNMLKYYGYSGSIVGPQGEKYSGTSKAGKIDELIQQADLITLEVGMCDVFYRPLKIAATKYGIDEDVDVDDLNAAQIADIVKIVTKEAYNGYNYWLKNYPKLIEKVKELNPDATIVIVGSFNMLDGMTMSDKTVTPVGSAFSSITNSMNAQYKKWASQYGVLYADICNTESVGTEQGIAFLSDECLEDPEIATHPGKEGYEYIARQIISVLPEKIVQNPTDIRVDLGQFKKVDYVRVNGKKITNYKMSGSVLTIPYGSKLAKTLTVSIVGTNNKIAVRSFTLKYDNGYTATRIYSTNDVEKTVTQPAKNVVTVAKSVVSKIKGLFK